MANIYRVLPFYMRAQNALWAWIARTGTVNLRPPAYIRLVEAAMADDAEARRRGIQ